MRVLVRHVRKDETPVTITTDFIKLDAFLKLANVCPSGGMAKNFILNEEVLVNGECCTMRGKKLHDGDKVTFDGNVYVVKHAD